MKSSVEQTVRGADQDRRAPAGGRRAWLDANCGAVSWTIAPASLNDASALYLNDGLSIRLDEPPRRTLPTHYPGDGRHVVASR